MKIAVISGLLKNESEMKKILDLVTREFGAYDFELEYINLNEEEISMYEGISDKTVDALFSKVLRADAVICATSIHMSNITPLLSNFLCYFELSKYRTSLLGKNVLPVVIHNASDDIYVYTSLKNVFSKFKMNEITSINIKIPEVIDEKYLDETCKYIKERTKIFALCLSPIKVEKIENNKIDNDKINQMLTSSSLVYDSKKVDFEKEDPKETNINEISGMISDRLKTQQILNDKFNMTYKDNKSDKNQDNNDINSKENLDVAKPSKEENVEEITKKYKTKIEEIMQETLFGDDDEDEKEETVAERIFKNAQEEIIEETNKKLDSITLGDKKKKQKKDKNKIKQNLEENDDLENVDTRAQEEKELDSLIARVVAKTKQKDEEEKQKLEELSMKQEKINEEKNKIIEERKANDLQLKIDGNKGLREDIAKEEENLQEKAKSDMQLMYEAFMSKVPLPGKEEKKEIGLDKENTTSKEDIEKELAKELNLDIVKEEDSKSEVELKAQDTDEMKEIRFEFDLDNKNEDDKKIKNESSVDEEFIKIITHKDDSSKNNEKDNEKIDEIKENEIKQNEEKEIAHHLTSSRDLAKETSMLKIDEENEENEEKSAFEMSSMEDLKLNDSIKKASSYSASELALQRLNKAKEEMTGRVTGEAKSSFDTNRFEPDSIKELKKRLNQIKESKEELRRERESIENAAKEDDVVRVSKFELEDFKEPHEVVGFGEKSKYADLNTGKSSLKDMTKNLIYLFKAPANESMKALVQVNVEGDEGFNLYLNILDNKCSVYDGVNMNNDLTIYVKDEKWREILDGRVTLQRAFMTGLVKVTGNFVMLNKLDNTLLAYTKEQ